MAKRREPEAKRIRFTSLLFLNVVRNRVDLRERDRKKRLCSPSVFRPILNSLLRAEEAVKSGGKRKGKRLLIKKQHSEYQKSKSVNSFRLTDCHAAKPNAPYPVPHPVPHQKRKYETTLPPPAHGQRGPTVRKTVRSYLKSRVNKRICMHQDITVLRPHTFVYTVTEVRGFFGKYGFITLAALVLLKLTLCIRAYTSIVH